MIGQHILAQSKFRYALMALVAVVVCLWGGLSKIIPGVKQLQHQYYLEQQLQVQLIPATNVANLIRSAQPQHGDAVTVQKLFLLANEHKIKIVRVKSASEKFRQGVAMIPLRFNLECTYTQWLGFLWALHVRHYPCVLSRFDLVNKGNGRLGIELELLFMPGHTFTQSMIKKRLPARDYFCADKNAYTHIDNHRTSALFSIRDMRWVGQLRQGSRIVGLIALPNNQILSVHLGMVLGVEKSLVQEFNDRSIQVVLPNKQKVLITERLAQADSASSG